MKYSLRISATVVRDGEAFEAVANVTVEAESSDVADEIGRRAALRAWPPATRAREHRVEITEAS